MTTTTSSLGGTKIDFGSILATGKYSDVTVECQGHVFKAHKAVLCCASAFFKAALEGQTKERDNNQVTLPEDEAAIIARLLIYIYTGTYHAQTVSSWRHQGTNATQFAKVKDPYVAAENDWRKSSFLAIAMYQIADKTFIEELKWTSRSRLLSSMRPDQNGEVLYYKFWRPEDTLDIIKIIISIYNSTRQDDWMLHDVIVHRMLIGIRDRGALKQEPYQKLLQDVPGLAVELATGQLGSRAKGLRCRNSRDRTGQRLWRCRCGLMENCSDENCIELRRVRSICDSCATFETCS